ncbi:serine hydrolase domain-containing protein [Amycolatopsis pithecellobii]|uniref:Serine hydrolase n=1 Tax=Amycolatopsis pithecellobii TaxID=664692 RepID=A0A6N7Z3R4_9PSEU|nr:serine hydrolase domain-containing protein [Amycolatopsis pithecellobii]MTD54921.1 serine hydrolase [Amycolatopsis pithecellobii]
MKFGLSAKCAAIACAVAVLVSACGGKADTQTQAAGAGAAPAGGVAQAQLDKLTSADNVPGVEALFRDKGQDRTSASGVANLQTKAPMQAGGRIRAGSITKSFVATVTLQLEAEGKVELDAPIDKYLPGLINGNGNDGTKITVRQLLQHTSGLPNYLGKLMTLDPEALRNQGADPADLVKTAVQQPPLFAPGTGWTYSNTNYIVIGMLVEKVTGDTLSHQIDARIVRPLKLANTYLPLRGDTKLPEPHAVGYVPAKNGVIDFSDYDSTMAWAAGGLVSTTKDVASFYEALLGGRILPPAQLKEMKTAVPAPSLGVANGSYGLGLFNVPLPCGGEYWGHEGSTFGFMSMAGQGTDGRIAVISANAYPVAPKATADIMSTFADALCSK